MSSFKNSSEVRGPDSPARGRRESLKPRNVFLIGLRRLYQTLKILDVDGRPRLNRRLLFGIPAAVFLAGSFQAFREIQRYAALPVMERSEVPAWRAPIEFNATQALPEFQGTSIRSVTLSQDRRQLWIGGSSGLLAYSQNRGDTWTLLTYNAKRGTFLEPGAAAPPPSPQQPLSPAPSVTNPAANAAASPKQPAKAKPGPALRTPAGNETNPKTDPSQQGPAQTNPKANPKTQSPKQQQPYIDPNKKPQ